MGQTVSKEKLDIIWYFHIHSCNSYLGIITIILFDRERVKLTAQSHQLSHSLSFHNGREDDQNCELIPRLPGWQELC